jgi:hypothetical protein
MHCQATYPQQVQLVIISLVLGMKIRFRSSSYCNKTAKYCFWGNGAVGELPFPSETHFASVAQYQCALLKIGNPEVLDVARSVLELAGSAGDLGCIVSP